MPDYEITPTSTEPITIEALETTLRSAGLDLDSWGQGKAKTLAHLHKEIMEGESTVNLTENGVERRVGVAGVDVLYDDQAGNTFRLVEDRQEFSDGRVRRRQEETSLSEKLKVGEDPEEAAKRALAEEIGVANIDSFHVLGHKEVERTSDSYPGLASIYDVYTYAAVLGPEDFNSEGYIEEQPDKINYYIWTVINSTSDS